MPVSKQLYFLIPLLAILFSLSSQGQPKKQPLFFLYEDSSKVLDESQALSLFNSGKFREAENNVFNPGFNNSIYWLAYRNDRELAPDSLLLHIGDHHINRIYFYFAADSNPQQQFVTGDYYRFSQRPLEVTGFYFPVQERGIYLARVDKSNESLQMVFWLTSLKKALKTEGDNAVVMALLSGMMLLMILFGIYLFFIGRERIYFYYIAYLFSGWLWVLANSGYGFQYIWPEAAWFASKARPIFAVMAGASSMLFLVSFVGAGNRVKKIVKWLTITSWVYVIAILAFNNEGYQSNWWRYVQYLIPVVTILYIASIFIFLVRKSIQGNRFAQFYLLGASVLIGTSIMQAAIHLGNFKQFQYFFSHFGLGIGYLAEAVILTAGLVYRFDQYRKEKEKLLIKMNDQQLQNTRILMEVQEAERSQVANQLHDVAGSLLSAAKLNLSSLQEKGFLNEAARTQAGNAEEAVGLVSEMVRNLSHALSPVMLEKVGFKTSLEKVVAIVNASGKINIQLLVLGFDKYEAGLNNIYTALYGITYELLNNIVKHSGAKNVLVQITENDESYSLIVEDDGIGIDQAQSIKKDNLGMIGIQSKISYFGGEIAFDKNQPTGLIVTIEIPIIRDE